MILGDGLLIIKGVQKLTLLDYPGHLAATVFTPGCNLRCPFCHNGSLVLDPGIPGLTEQEVLEFLASRAGRLDGVCITGGEPLLQQGLREFILKVRALGLAVKLDTNGFFPARLRELLEGGLVDYVAMDIKNSPRRYGETSGVEGLIISPVLESIRLLRTSEVEHEFRTTLVRELHDPQSVREAAELVAGAEHYFLQSFKDSGDILRPGLSAFSQQELQQLLAAAREQVPAAQLRGV